MIITEQMLDGLHTLQMKRAAEITNTGADFELEGTEKVFRGLLTPDQKTIRFHTHTPLVPTQVYSRKGTRFFILGVCDKAGCKEATVAQITKVAQLYRKQTGPAGTSLVLDTAELPIFGKDGAVVIAPRYAAASVGKILKTASSLMEITSARIDGPTALLSVKTYSPEPTKSLQPKRPEPPRVQTFKPVRVWDFSTGYGSMG